jgi:hypothetical protein
VAIPNPTKPIPGPVDPRIGWLLMPIAVPAPGTRVRFAMPPPAEANGCGQRDHTR